MFPGEGLGMLCVVALYSSLQKAPESRVGKVVPGPLGWDQHGRGSCQEFPGGGGGLQSLGQCPP